MAETLETLYLATEENNPIFLDIPDDNEEFDQY